MSRNRGHGPEWIGLHGPWLRRLDARERRARRSLRRRAGRDDGAAELLALRLLSSATLPRWRTRILERTAEAASRRRTRVSSTRLVIAFCRRYGPARRFRAQRRRPGLGAVARGRQQTWRHRRTSLVGTLGRIGTRWHRALGRGKTWNNRGTQDRAHNRTQQTPHHLRPAFRPLPVDASRQQCRREGRRAKATIDDRGVSRHPQECGTKREGAAVRFFEVNDAFVRDVHVLRENGVEVNARVILLIRTADKSADEVGTRRLRRIFHDLCDQRMLRRERLVAVKGGFLRSRVGGLPFSRHRLLFAPSDHSPVPEQPNEQMMRLACYVCQAEGAE